MAGERDWEIWKSLVMNFSVHPLPTVESTDQEQDCKVPILTLSLTSRVTLDKLPNPVPQFPHLYLAHRFAKRIK